MPPNSYGDALGLGSQNIGDFLSLSDTPTLRKKYYDTLQGGLDTATQQAAPDQGNLLWQGIIPALAAAILTKGKSFGFSGAPLQNVLDTENKRAADTQKFNVEAKLKGAGLFGEELGRRESLATATANREEALAQTKEQKEADREQAKSLREATLEQTKELKQESLAQSEKQFQQGDETKRLILEQRAADTAQNQADRQDYRQSLLDIQKEKLGEGEKKGLEDSFNAEVKTRGLDKKIEGLRTVEAILNQPDEKIGPASIQAVKESLTRGLIGARPANATMEALIPTDLVGKTKTYLNFIESGRENPLSDAKLSELRALSKILHAEAVNGIIDIHKRLSSTTRGGYLKQTGEFDNTLKSMGSSYGITPDLTSGQQSNAVSPETKFKTAKGVFTYQQLKQIPGFTDDMLTNAQQVP